MGRLVSRRVFPPPEHYDHRHDFDRHYDDDDCHNFLSLSIKAVLFSSYDDHHHWHAHHLMASIALIASRVKRRH